MAADDEQATKKQPAKKQAAKKRPARKDADNEESAKKPAQKVVKKPAKKSGGGTGSRDDGRAAPKASSSRRPKPLELAREAGAQLLQLTGRQPESTTGIERTDDGWRIELEVVETRRIPDTADILAVYEVQMDEDGDLISYRRISRYPRGRTDPGDGGGR